MHVLNNSISKYTPKIEERKPSKEEFLSLIETAQKTDHQIYTEKRLSPFSFDTSANLPGLFNLVTAPYDIISTLTKIPQEKLKQVSVSLERAHYKMIAHMINFIGAAITPLLYITVFCGITALEIAFVTPVLFTLGLTISIMEIYVNARDFHKQHKFLKTIDLTLLKKFSQATIAFSKERLNEAISSLIKRINTEDIFANKDYKKQLLEDLRMLQKKLKENPETNFTEAKDQLKDMLNNFKKEFVTEKIELLDSQFLSIGGSLKKTLMDECEKHYHKYSYSKALHYSFSLTQDVFEERKILLANRVQPWLALKIISNYKSILSDLKSDDLSKQQSAADQGLELLERVHYNASIKKHVFMTNIALFGLIIASYIFSAVVPVGPIIPIALFGGATVIHSINSSRINGMLNSQTYKVEWKNYLPAWIKSLASKIDALGCKIHFLFNKAKPHSILHSVEKLTLPLKKDTLH